MRGPRPGRAGQREIEIVEGVVVSTTDKRGSRRVAGIRRFRLKYKDVDTFVEKYAANVSKGGIFIMFWGTPPGMPLDTPPVGKPCQFMRLSVRVIECDLPELTISPYG